MKEKMIKQLIFIFHFYPVATYLETDIGHLSEIAISLFLIKPNNELQSTYLVE